MSAGDTEPDATGATTRDAGGTAGNTGMNALLGGVVAVIFAFLPLSTVLGGAVAGYLQRGEYRDGALVGAIAGVLALLPMLAFGSLFGGFLFAGPMMGVPGGFAALSFALLGFVLFASAVYTVGFGALGGVLGVYLAEEVDL